MQTPSRDTIANYASTSGSSIGTDDRTILIACIDEILPQTQCRQCGYDGCKPYATAIAQGQAQINQCPPGGDAGIRALADLLHLPALPLDTAHGVTKPKALAVIDEQRCIGCTLCIQACPVDAILGASKQMHTVISQECTGCELCLAPCPVDCIIMLPETSPGDTHQAMVPSKAAANLARTRHQNRQARLARETQQRTQAYARKKPVTASSAENLAKDSIHGAPNAEAVKKAAIAAAMARVKALKLANTKPADRGE
jgi:electron transport complex protein RnfB